MNARPAKPEAETQSRGSAPPGHETFDDGIDLSLLDESLSKTVWERMLANDDALRLADMLQAAIMKSRAKP